MGECGINIGGQAVIEGVMMRAPQRYVVVVRRPDQKIVILKKDIKIDGNSFFRKPFVRGLIGLYDALILGIQALNFSAHHALGEGEEKLSFKEIFFTMIFGLGLGILLFLFLPLLLTDLLKYVFPIIAKSFFVYNLVDGIIRVIFFVLYIYFISFFKDVKRVFQYHGAEHKSIYTFESGKDLTIENARVMSRFHPRCGTSFLLIVMIVSIFIFTLIPKDSHFLIKFLSRIIFVPVIAGVSYEILKLSAKYQNNFIVKMLISPGLWLQHLTTQEPDDSQLEVALISIKEALNKNDNGEGLIYV